MLLLLVILFKNRHFLDLIGFSHNCVPMFALRHLKCALFEIQMKWVHFIHVCMCMFMYVYVCTVICGKWTESQQLHRLRFSVADRLVTTDDWWFWCLFFWSKYTPRCYQSNLCHCSFMHITILISLFTRAQLYVRARMLHEYATVLSRRKSSLSLSLDVLSRFFIAE